MIFEPSTIFVLATTAGLIALVVWADIYSRRHHRPATPEQPAPASGVRPARRPQ